MSVQLRDSRHFRQASQDSEQAYNKIKVVSFLTVAELVNLKKMLRRFIYRFRVLSIFIVTRTWCGSQNTELFRFRYQYQKYCQYCRKCRYRYWQVWSLFIDLIPYDLETAYCYLALLYVTHWKSILLRCSKSQHRKLR